jgi:hypothetical protein
MAQKQHMMTLYWWFNKLKHKKICEDGGNNTAELEQEKKKL